MTQSQSVLEAALALPDAERLWVAERLLETLPPDLDETTDDEFAAELDRRRAEVQRGEAKLIPWSELRRNS
jgi:putative addiction module component (TIGR02574 family)